MSESEHSTGAPNAEPVWRELSGTLFRFFRTRVRNDADAEDLVQETLLRVQTRLTELEGVDRTAAWIQRIARNVWIDDARARGAAPPVSAEDEGEIEGEPASDEGDLTTLVAGWLAARIDELDPESASVLRRSELRGERHRDIAADLGLSVSAIKSRVQRGRARIRQSLEDCCRLEFDRRGGVVDYRRRRAVDDGDGADEGRGECDGEPGC